MVTPNIFICIGMHSVNLISIMTPYEGWGIGESKFEGWGLGTCLIQSVCVV